MTDSISKILHTYFHCKHAETTLDSQYEMKDYYEIANRLARSVDLNQIGNSWYQTDMTGLKVICLSLLTKNIDNKSYFNRGNAIELFSEFETEFGSGAVVLTNTNLYDKQCYRGQSFSYNGTPLMDALFSEGVVIFSKSKAYFFCIYVRQ